MIEIKVNPYSDNRLLVKFKLDTASAGAVMDSINKLMFIASGGLKASLVIEPKTGEITIESCVDVAQLHLIVLDEVLRGEAVNKLLSVQHQLLEEGVRS